MRRDAERRAARQAKRDQLHAATRDARRLFDQLTADVEHFADARPIMTHDSGMRRDVLAAMVRRRVRPCAHAEQLSPRPLIVDLGARVAACESCYVPLATGVDRGIDCDLCGRLVPANVNGFHPLAIHVGPLFVHGAICRACRRRIASIETT